MECSQDMAGQVVDGYELLRPIGRGGFGVVWLCRNLGIGDLRAMKRVETGSDSRLDREVRALAAYRDLAPRSPHLVPVEHISRQTGALCYVMPLADGCPGVDDPLAAEWRPFTVAALLDLRCEGRWLSAGEIGAIMLAVLGGLEVLAASGLVHRDVKPDNILFFGGRPCLADISLMTHDQTVHSRVGTPGYAAPSWYLGGHPDMYGAAATLYSLLTGNAPDKMGRGAFLWPPGGRNAVSASERPVWERLHGVVRRASEERVGERFRDFAAMASAVTSAIAGDAGEGSHVGGGKRHTRSLAAGGIVAAVLAAIALIPKWGQRQQEDGSVPAQGGAPTMSAERRADYQALVAMIQGYLRERRYGNALATVKILLAEHPESREQPAYSIARAQALVGLGREAEAREELRRDLHLSPNLTVLRARLQLWRDMDDAEAAEEDISRVIDTFGPATMPLFLRAGLRAERGNYAGCHDDRLLALTLSQDDPDMQRQLVDAMWTELEEEHPGYAAHVADNQ